MNLANLISLSRVPLAIFGSYYFLTGQILGSLWCLVFAALSDFFDGRLAKVFGSHKWGAYYDMGSDLFFEFTLAFTFTFIGELPWWLGTLILFRISVQTFLVAIFLRILQSPLSFHRRKRVRVSSALTWLVYFFYLMNQILVLEAPPLSEGIEQIILPYILFPMAACMELFSIRLLFTQYKYSIKKL